MNRMMRMMIMLPMCALTLSSPSSHLLAGTMSAPRLQRYKSEPAPKTTRDRRHSANEPACRESCQSDEEARRAPYLRRERCCERPNHCCGLRARKAVRRRAARRGLPGEASERALPPKCRGLRHPADARSERTRAERADVESDRR
jgi:hypothetical protein